MLGFADLTTDFLSKFKGASFQMGPDPVGRLLIGTVDELIIDEEKLGMDIIELHETTDDTEHLTGDLFFIVELEDVTRLSNGIFVRSRDDLPYPIKLIF